MPIKCKNCGKDIPDDSSFCLDCGESKSSTADDLDSFFASMEDGSAKTKSGPPATDSRPSPEKGPLSPPAAKKAAVFPAAAVKESKPAPKVNGPGSDISPKEPVPPKKAEVLKNVGGGVPLKAVSRPLPTVERKDSFIRYVGLFIGLVILISFFIPVKTPTGYSWIFEQSDLSTFYDGVRIFHPLLLSVLLIIFFTFSMPFMLRGLLLIIIGLVPLALFWTLNPLDKYLAIELWHRYLFFGFLALLPFSLYLRARVPASILIRIWVGISLGLVVALYFIPVRLINTDIHQPKSVVLQSDPDKKGETPPVKSDKPLEKAQPALEKKELPIKLLVDNIGGNTVESSHRLLYIVLLLPLLMALLSLIPLLTSQQTEGGGKFFCVLLLLVLFGILVSILNLPYSQKEGFYRELKGFIQYYSLIILINLGLYYFLRPMIEWRVSRTGSQAKA